MSEFFSSTAKAMEWLVRGSLPEFFSQKQKSVANNAKNINFRRQREDGIFERIFIVLSVDKTATAISVQIAANYFFECPTLGGPFGFGMSLPILVKGELAKELREYWYFDSWYKMAASLRSDSPFLELAQTALKGPVREKFDEWAKTLLLDDILRIAVGTYNEIEKAGDLCSGEETLSRRLDKMGPFSDNGHPIEKIKRQLLFRLQGNKNWYLL